MPSLAAAAEQKRDNRFPDVRFAALRWCGDLLSQSFQMSVVGSTWWPVASKLALDGRYVALGFAFAMVVVSVAKPLLTHDWRGKPGGGHALRSSQNSLTAQQTIKLAEDDDVSYDGAVPAIFQPGCDCPISA